MGFKGVVGAAFLVAAVIAILFGGAKLVEANAMAWTGVATTATITGVERVGRMGSAIVYTFEDGSGRRFTGQARVGFDGQGRLARKRRAETVGQRVRVFYDPADPARSVPDNFWGRWGYLLMMLFVLPHLAIGVWLIREDRREAAAGGGWARRGF